MSLCIFSVAQLVCAGTHTLVRQHSTKGQGNCTYLVVNEHTHLEEPLKISLR